MFMYKNPGKMFYCTVLIVWLSSLLITGCESKPGDQPVTPVKDSAVATSQPAAPPSNFKNEVKNVNGFNIHYVIGGTGTPLLLIHGFGQNWFMWNRLLPELSKHFTVIAPDLPGLGESDKPDSGYDKKTLAADLHGLVKQLGFSDIEVVGHDIGLMVAYAYAAQYANEVKKLALLDALLPGVEPVWSQVRAQAWWFGFFGWSSSASIVAGKEKEFLTGFWPVVGHVNNAFTKEETNEFFRAYTTPRSTYGAFHWFAAFSQDAKDNEQFMKTKLKMPLLAMAGEYSGTFLPDHCRLVAESVTASIIKGAGHWLVQENTEQVQHDLLGFLATK